MPVSKREEDMEGEGWHKELTIPKIVFDDRTNTIYVEEYDFFADRMPCHIKDGGTGPECGIDHTWIKNQAGKLLWTCHRHKMAQGPLTFDIGVRADKYIITATEAGRIYDEIGVREDEMPQQLRNLIARESQVKLGTIRSRPKHRAATKTKQRERAHKKRTITESKDILEK